MTPPLPPPLIVCLCAPGDAATRDALGRHLAPAESGQRLRYWHPGLLSPGVDVLRTTRQQLREAALVLPLLSDDFYGDGTRDLRPLLDALPPERVVPVLARAVAYKAAGDGMTDKQVLPRDGHPLRPRTDADQAYVAVVHEVLAALERLGPRAAAPLPDKAPAEHPPPQAAGATYDPRWFVSRGRQERAARQRLGGPGLPVVLQGPQLFGKSWLLEHLLTPLRGVPGLRLVELNLAALSQDDRGNPHALRRALAERILGACDLPAAWLDEHLGPRHDDVLGFEALLRRVLQAAPAPLCLSMDRADDLPSGPVRTGFYKQLRAFVDGGVRPPWSLLRLVLCISTTPSELQPDATASPFNGAEVILLDELDDEQVLELLRRYGLRWSNAERQAVRERVGGHPYLLRLLMDEAAQDGTPVSALLDGEPEALDAYLSRLDQALATRPELREALRQVHAQGHGQPGRDPTPTEYWRLHRMGLLDRIKGTRKVRLRCTLYHPLVE